MANWITLPSEPLISQPSQQRFLDDRRLRLCKKCRIEFKVEVYKNPPIFACPGCGGKGTRVYDRMSIIAGRRFGKTRFGTIAMVEELAIPNTIAWACAPTNPKLHRYILPAFQQLIPLDWVASWDRELLDLRLKNGSLLHLQTLEDPDQGRGQGIDVLYIDEVAELTRAHWEVISPSLGDRRGLAYFTTSPRGYDWTWDAFYKPAVIGVPGYWSLKARTCDNPKFQDEEGRAFLARERERLSDVMYRQEYEGDFVTFEGAVYGEALKETHVLRTLDQIRRVVPSYPDVGSYQAIVGIDTGADHPFGGVKIISTEKGLVIVDEYLERHKSFFEHAAALRRLGNGSSTWYAINKNERQPMIELAQHGIYCKAAQNDLVAGVERVKSWMFANQFYIIAEKAPKTLEQLKSYRWADNYSPKDGSSKGKEKVFKKDDELPDCIRYACMVWPQLPVPVEQGTPARDLSELPRETRHAIERMRRIDKMEKDGEFDQDTVDGVGDFFVC